MENVGFDTDVNAPALAEFRHRCHVMGDGREVDVDTTKPLTSLAYVTIGTGVGVGLIVNSLPVHGLLHPEGGHCPIHTLPDDTFQGYSWGKEMSPFGGVGTVEGVASSVALTERLLDMDKNPGVAVASDSNISDASNASTRSILSTLPDTHPIWSHASNAIANLCVTILLLTSCQTIVLGGGVMNRSILYERIRKEVLVLLNGYLDVDELKSEEKLRSVIGGSSWESLGLGSGLVGAFALALDSLEHGQNDTLKKERREPRRDFCLGILAGIGLSFGCGALVLSFACWR